MSSNEEVFYSAGNVQITDKRAQIGGETYAMSNITSVSQEKIGPNRLPAFLLTLIGLSTGVCCGGLGISSQQAATGPGPAGPVAVPAIAALLGLGVAGLGIYWAMQMQPKHVVNLGSASGQKEALVSKDEAHISQTVQAINEAIISRD